MSVGVKVFVAVFLMREGKVLLLRRARDKAFAPGRWTGVGGQVEVDEMGDLAGAALREVYEETDLGPHEVRDLRLRVVLTQPEAGQAVVLAFFTGRTDREDVGPCDEGQLHWIDIGAVGSLDMIGNARQALDLAVREVEANREGVFFGVCDPDEQDGFRSMTLGPDSFLIG